MTSTPTAEPPSIEEQKKIIKELFGVKLREAQEWCVIDFKWWQMWQQYVNYDGDGTGDGERPGAMENSQLLEDPADPEGALKPELRENYDHSLIPKTAYLKFQEWFGGGPRIIRSVVTTGIGQTLKVDLYPIRIKWKKYGTTDEKALATNKNAKVKELKYKISQRLSMPPTKVRLWVVDPHTNENFLLDDENKTLGDNEIEEGDCFIAETKANDDQWPMERNEGREPYVSSSGASRSNTSSVGEDGLPPVGTVTFSATNPNSGVAGRNTALTAATAATRTMGGTSTLMGMSYRERYKNTEGSTSGPGLCGLNNLGNTCFMNSALQCLSNTVPLTNYFLTNEFVKDVNRTNVLGMKGQLADHYSILMKELWSSKFKVVAPVTFKYMLGKFAPQFSGYQQHDSQELLAFLLDGLHEDMNRVVQKPYVESVESNGRPDDEVAQEAWEAHLKRNRSIIVDLFQGQFKSTVNCPVCDRVSITFDPFMYLSVPLPVSNERVMHVSCIYLEKPPVKYAIKLSKNGVVTDIKKAMTTVTGLSVEQMGICDIYAHKIFKILPENHPVKLIKDNDEIFCFEIVANDDKLTPEKLEIRKKERKAAKLARKAANSEAADPAVVPQAGEPMETDEAKPGTSAEPKDVEMKDNDDKEKEKEKGAEDEEAKKASEKEKGKKKQKKKPYLKYVSVIHRELRNSTLKKGRRYDLFGYPFVLSVDPEFVTNRQLYEMIWHHIQQIYRKEEEVKMEDADAAKERLEKIEQELKEKTDLNEEEIRGLKGVGPYPFTLFLGTNHNFTASGMKEVPLNDEIQGALPNAYKVHFNIDWTDEGIAKHFNKAKITEDPSVKELKAEESKSIPLASCLELFNKKEQLSAENAWYCSKCGEHREAFKKFDIWKTPAVMVVHLKRFQFTKYWRDKIESLVDFPEVLDMSAYISGPIDPAQPPLYSLYAVSNHSGSMGFGHYTAYAKNKQDSKWYYFNDSSVSEASSKDVVSESAYLLFYVRQDVENTTYAPFEYSQEEVDQFVKKMNEEMEAEKEKEREKEKARYGVGIGAGTAANRGRYSLDDIDGVSYGPNLPGKGKGKDVAGDPMDTDYATAAVAGVAGYYPPGSHTDDEEEGPVAGDVGLRSRRNVPPSAGVAAAAAAAAVTTLPPGMDPASVFAAATAGNIHVAPGLGHAVPNPNDIYPRGPLDPADPMQTHEKDD